MSKYLKTVLVILAFMGCGFAQPTLNESISFEEYLAFVKKYHPLFKQANLTLSVGEANLLKAKITNTVFKYLDMRFKIYLDVVAVFGV